MKYQLAQLNLAKFRVPADDPVNIDFVSNLDRVNAIAESQPGFVWRLTGEGNSALDIHAFDDPNIAANMSVWENIESLVTFAYRNEEHQAIMRRRREWFDKMEFYLVLWWIEAGHTPSLEEAISRLDLLRESGPGPQAFTFKQPYPAPGGEEISPFTDKCA